MFPSYVQANHVSKLYQNSIQTSKIANDLTEIAYIFSASFLKSKLKNIFLRTLVLRFSPRTGAQHKMF